MKRPIQKVLVANRGEIAIRIFRACTELKISTVAIYSEEDTSSLHRFKADEAYLVGRGKGPIEAYLDIDEVLRVAKKHNVDAIHPGYGFLAENAAFAERCEQEGLIFIGPHAEHLRMFGDKVVARQQASLAHLPIIPGLEIKDEPLQAIETFGKTHGYPIMLKAAAGGGGRGMRIIYKPEEIAEAYERASSEAKATFCNAEVYIERFIESPKHIEIQILGDHYGNIVHLYERDCSVQRRYQKLVEVAPSVSIAEEMKQKLFQAALNLMHQAKYYNAGTVEFLVSDDQFYFIEVNPRIQVEHTITELITGIDIVQAQLLIAQGYSLHEAPLAIPAQERIHNHGFAIQCRVTTEDPAQNFQPDVGKILAYRSSGGFGTRLDAGNGFAGATISPYYDSLLVKVSTWAITYEQAVQKMNRNLREFRIRGVKTNIPFLINVINHPHFITGQYNTSFVDQTNALFKFPTVRDRGTKLLQYIAENVVNGFPGLEKPHRRPVRIEARIPVITQALPSKQGTKQLLEKLGAERFVQWIKKEQRVLLTDTTMRDAHQSLFATRMRSIDMLNIAEEQAALQANLFSLECWGGATFDVAYRFLHEDPWQRLAALRQKVPNLLLQMLLRGANAVGYTNYPDNVVRGFIHEAAAGGIDLFRIFDSLNWLEGMRVSIDEVLKQGKLAEVAICYTGDLHHASRTKYHLDYYLRLAKEIEATGAHILAIKDMAGLLKPYAAVELIKALKQTVSMPIHLHTHDSTGNGLPMYLKAIEAGADIVDVAYSSMSGLTSQPSLNALVAALTGHARDPQLKLELADQINMYWEDVRKYYSGFESTIKSTSTEVYNHEMPGGQYSNLEQQAKSVGLGERWEEVKRMYQQVNLIFGDIVKVTPSSKVVGDMALFMVQNNLNEQDLYTRGERLDFPASVVEFFEGKIGQPAGGFPKALQRLVLKGRESLTVRPGELMEPVDIDHTRGELKRKLNKAFAVKDVLSYILYPQVFEAYQKQLKKYENVSVLDTITFFYGLELGEEVRVEIEQGKTLSIKLISVSELQEGYRTVYFELNGQPREIRVLDQKSKAMVQVKEKADPHNINHIGATMPGTILALKVREGDQVKKGDPLIITEAMKMETTLQAPQNGQIKHILVKEKDSILAGDLLIIME